MRLLLPAALLFAAASCASEAPVTSGNAGAQGAEAHGTVPTAAPEVTETSPAVRAASTTVEAPETTAAAPVASMAPAAAGSGLYGLSTETLEGDAIDLAEFEGQVTLVVNVASRCGYTRQYAGLQELHAELEGEGFAVLAFPSNEFGGQEPGSPSEIREFCSSKFDVSFPMFAKCEVKPGAGQSPVFGFLHEQTDEFPGWNFCKYLVGKDGQVIGFFKSSVEPDSAELREAIEAAMG